jgi:hypothetical protein
MAVRHISTDRNAANSRAIQEATATPNEFDDAFDPDIKRGQGDDPEIQDIRNMIQDGKRKPSSDTVSPWSAASKTLWAQWEQLRVVNGDLY